MIVFVVAIVLCLGLLISAVTGFIVPFMILVLVLASGFITATRVYKVKEHIARKNGKLAVAELVSIKDVFSSETRNYYMIKFKYTDEYGVERVRHDLVHYTEEELDALGLEDGHIDVIVHKKFAVSLNPYEVVYLNAQREILKEKEKLEEEELNKELEDIYHKNADGDTLKECPYCGYKTFEDDFKCPMCGGELDFKKKKKPRKKSTTKTEEN